MAKNKYRYLAKNTFLFTISSFGSKILSFLLVPLYTNILTTADYGTADLISTTATLLLYVVTLNIADSVLRFAIERTNGQNEILGYGIKIVLKGNFIFSFLLLAFAIWNPINWNSNLYIFLYLNILINSFHSLATNYLRAINKVKEVAIAGILSTAVIIISNIFTLLIIKIGIDGYLFSMIAGPLVSAVYCIFKCDGFWSSIKRASKDINVRKAMLAYSLPLILNGIAWWMNASLDKYFIAAFLGTSENGIYAVAQKIPTILTTFFSVFMQAWILSAIKEFDRDDKDGFFTNTYNTINSSLVILSSGLILFNIFLARILYAKDFFVAWKCSCWLIISTVFSSMSSFEGGVFSAQKDSRIYAISTVISAIVNIVLNFLLIPRLGIQGAAIATAISFFSIWVIRYVCMRKYIHLKTILWKDILAYFLLVVQVILEQSTDHCYLGQIIIFFLIIIIYITNLKDIFYLIFKKLFSWKKPLKQ